MESKAADLGLLDKVEGGWPAESGWTRVTGDGVKRKMLNDHVDNARGSERYSIRKAKDQRCLIATPLSLSLCKKCSTTTWKMGSVCSCFHV